ncbi:MAG: S41 family peptidase [Pseudomonadota bacterium]
MRIRFVVLLGVLLSIVTGVTLGAALYRERRAANPEAALLDSIVQLVRSNYYREVSRSELLEGALDGVIGALDEHSRLLDADGIQVLEADTRGRFGGIGVEVGVVAGRLQVIAPIPNTPAARAGIRAGDVIIAADDYRVDESAAPGRPGHDIGALLERLRGEPGSRITVTIERDAAVQDFELRRDVIQVASVRARLLEPARDALGYVRIRAFQSDTATELAAALKRLRATAEAPLAGLVLDVRNNPGGLLNATVAVADHFLEAGDIVSTRGRDGANDLRYRAQQGDLLNGAPMVVLINSGSASGAEIVAGALQDSGRALILGSRSYGKGTVQSVLAVDHDHALKLTTAEYFTPRGRSIHEIGITPDTEIRAPVGMSFEDALMQRARAELQRHTKPDA